MSGSVRKVIPALSDVREKLGGPSSCPGVGGSPPECPGVDARPSWMSGSLREACRIFGSGRKAIPNVREWSGGPP